MKTTASEATLHFSGKAVTTWGALALMQRMLTAIGFRAARLLGRCHSRALIAALTRSCSLSSFW